jgi:hypothetical protein
LTSSIADSSWVQAVSRITGRSGWRARIWWNSATPSSPEVVSAWKFMSWITRSTSSRASASSPACGVSARRVRMSCSENSTSSAVPTAGLSSMTRMVGMAGL